MAGFYSWTTIIFICAITNKTLSRRSPHADLVDEYFSKGPEAGRYSNDLLEDAKLDVPDLIRKYGYPCDIHHPITDDGYVLELQRIRHGRDQNTVYYPNKPVVLVMHGLLASSADWVVAGPGSALAYILAEAGYDVWLGNARGNTYSRNHVKFDPNVDLKDFWIFSWEEMGLFDLPAMIDYILAETGKSRIHYIGHSQGTTMFWVMGSLRPEYNEKIITMQAFAPVAFQKYNKNKLFLSIGPFANNIEMIGSQLGVYELFPRSELVAWFGRTFCADSVATQPLCTNFLFLVAGTREDMLNSTLLPLKLGHVPGGAAARQIVHFAQNMGKDFFRRFDHGLYQNWFKYNSFIPPDYDLSKITAPIYLHYVDDDIFAQLNDLETLYLRLRNAKKFRVDYATFSHLDFMWGIAAKSLLYDKTIDLMNEAGSD